MDYLPNDHRIVYLNGEFVRACDARISPFDRGFLFADGVYEMTSVLNGKLIDNTAHLQRLERSLAELKIALPCSIDNIARYQAELIMRNGLREGALYLQITRGAADRDFAFPKSATPTLFMFTQQKALIDNPLAVTGLKVITLEDIRWKRRDIKTVALLAASMAKQAALDAGVNDAWLVEEGFITEGSSNNVYLLTEDDVVVTRAASPAILDGVTKGTVLGLAQQLGLKVEERPFTPGEAYAAKEAFLTSATTFALPVVEIDGHIIGDGKPGPVARQIREKYIQAALASNG